MPLSLLSSLIAISATITLVIASQSQSLTIWNWPLSASSPSPLATLTYDPLTLNTTTTAYTPPVFLSDSDSKSPEIVRVGFYDPKVGAKSWSGTATSLASFNPQAQHLLSLTVDRDGEPRSVSFHGFLSPLDPREERRRAKREERARKREEEAIAAGKVPKSKAGRNKQKKNDVKREQPMVEVTRMKEGKRPTLNKPVVVNEAGQVEGQGQEKTFLQKYWWAIAIFLVVQLLAGGAGKEEGK
ncbi:MAG: hypothetical protein Q9159_005669 [Coniocarpon cinnabarinum]